MCECMCVSHILLSTVSKLDLLYLPHCCDNLLNVLFIQEDNKAQEQLDMCDYFDLIFLLCVHVCLCVGVRVYAYVCSRIFLTGNNEDVCRWVFILPSHMLFFHKL